MEPIAATPAPPYVAVIFTAVPSSDRAGYGEMAERMHTRGLGLGYHNHEWEFATRLDGRSAHAVLVEALLRTGKIDVRTARKVA